MDKMDRTDYWKNGDTYKVKVTRTWRIVRCSKGHRMNAQDLKSSSTTQDWYFCQICKEYVNSPIEPRERTYGQEASRVPTK